ncbi:MAG: hypothetical protein JW854_17235, partial [Actinobacteria bacterium]|nr:hypothetical protein [Actinomycetota bacterium]
MLKAACRNIRKKPASAGLGLLLLLLLSFLFLSVHAGCGGSDTPSEVEAILAKAQDAADTIDSYRMVL